MHGIELVQDLAFVMAAAAVATVLCQKLRQPVVLGYIVAGIIIGPNTPPLCFVTNEEEIKTLAELGVVLLMFSVGLHFSFRKLKEVGLVAIVAALLEIAGMFFLGERIGRLFGWGVMESVFLGAILAISSTTIIAKTLEGSVLPEKSAAAEARQKAAQWRATSVKSHSTGGRLFRAKFTASSSTRRPASARTRKVCGAPGTEEAGRLRFTL